MDKLIMAPTYRQVKESYKDYIQLDYADCPLLNSMVKKNGKNSKYNIS